MRRVGRYLWLVPAAAGVAYALATHDHLPPEVGGGTSSTALAVEWFALLGIANAAFVLLDAWLPRMGDRMLAVPGRGYWLAGADRRAELVDRLRGICESALLLSNVFFAAVYQAIYQTNAPHPAMTVPMAVLVPCFMVLPVLLALGSVALTLRGLAAEARRAGTPPPDQRGIS